STATTVPCERCTRDTHLPIRSLPALQSAAQEESDGPTALQHARLAPPWRPDDRFGLPPGTPAHGRRAPRPGGRGALRPRRRPDPGAGHVAERLPLPGPGFPRAVRPPGKSTGAEEKVSEGACNLRLDVDNGSRWSRRPPTQPAPRQRLGLSMERHT